jgi:hypothetical protein
MIYYKICIDFLYKILGINVRMREGCEGHEVALPLLAKYEQAKDCRSESAARSSPTRSEARGTPSSSHKKL